MNFARLMQTMRERRIHDFAIAIGLFALAVVTVPQFADDNPATHARDLLGYALLALQTLPLMWRQVAPRTVMLVAAVGWATDRGLNYEQTVATAGLIVAVHAIGAYLPPRKSWPAAGVVFVVAVGWTAVGVAVGVVGWLELATIGLYVAVPYGIGRADAISRARITELELKHQAAEQAKRGAADAAVRLERARIARELHDVVAHEITVMTLQAEGASRRTRGEDPALGEALANISASGRKGLEEMQRMISVLRDTAETERDGAPAVGTPQIAVGGGHDLAPVPSLAAIAPLVTQVEEAGLPVDLRIEGNAHVPAGVELSAYRIVQESLTNALKHAGPGAHATVVVDRAPRRVEVTVEDDGRGVVSDAARQSGGHGLTGMRERVVALGGEIEFGPRTGGGFRVRATLPSHDDTVTARERASR